MRRRIPPLNSLRAFEAAARHLSFTRAADELSVTQAAVSHQVKALEERLGVPLFKRRNRSLLLTDEGQEYLPALRHAFELIDQATRRLERQIISAGAERILTVTTIDSIAAKWLVPRLGRFQDRHPEIEVRLTTTDRILDLTHGDIDMGLRYGTGDYSGCESIWLMDEELFPVCAPSLLANGPPLDKPEDLSRHRLLHDDMQIDWKAWKTAAGSPDLEPAGRMSFTHSNLLIQAAIEGQGVALGRSVLVADDIAAGHLVQPFDLSLPAPHAYYIVYAEERADEPKIAAFRDWIIEEAKAYAKPARLGPRALAWAP